MQAYKLADFPLNGKHFENSNRYKNSWFAHSSNMKFGSQLYCESYEVGESYQVAEFRWASCN